MLKKIMLIFGLLVFGSAWAQETGIIEGVVQDHVNRLPIENANVMLVGTRWGDATDAKGRFQIKGIPPGNFTLHISAVGFHAVSREIVINAGAHLKFSFMLRPKILQAPEITVTESGFRPAEPYNLKVIRRSDYRPSIAAELIADIPGVNVQRVGSWGSKPVIRGFRDEQVVVYVDGVRINRAGPAKMDAALATVPVEQIEKVEVLRGPRAAIYGPGAIGGMISVVSNTASRFSPGGSKIQWDGFFRVSAASAAKKLSETAGLSLQTKKLSFSSVAGNLAQRDYSTPDGSIPNTAFRERFINLSLKLRPAQRHLVALSSQFYRLVNAGFPGLAAEIPDDDRDMMSLSYVYRNPESILKSTQIMGNYLRMYHHMIVTAVDNSMMKVDADVRATSMTHEVKFRQTYVWSKKWSSLVGGDFYRWNASASRQRTIFKKMSGTWLKTDEETIWPDVRLHDVGLFVQNTFILSRAFDLEMGVRFDHIFADGQVPQNSVISSSPHFRRNFIGGNLIGTFKLFPSITFSLGMGRTFRTPDPGELYISIPLPVGTGTPPLAYFVGNPELDLEKSTQFELSIGGDSNRWQWTLNLYHHRVQNLILAVVTGDSLNGLPVRKYQNLPLAVIAGGEFRLTWVINPKFSLENGFSFARGETRSSLTGIPNRAPLPEIPPFEWSTDLRYQVNESLSGTLSGRIVAPQNRVADYTRERPTPGFWLLDFKGVYQWRDRLTILFGVRNLLNTRYSEHLNQIGRSRSVSIQKNLDRIIEPGRDVFMTIQWMF